MTYMTLRVRDHAGPADAARLEQPNIPNPPIANLDLSARNCGPLQLRDWAAGRDLVVYWVDNGWCRVVVTGVELRAFLEQFAGEGGEPDRADRFAASSNFIIEAEEY